MKIVANILIAIGIIAILFLIFLLVGFCLYTMTPDLKSQISVSQSADAAKSFADKVETFKKEAEDAAINKEKKEVVLVITDEEINSKIIEQIAEGKLPFKELLINFKENLSWLYFVYDNPVVNAKVGMILKPEIVKGNIKVTVMDFHVGKLPLSKSFNETVADILNVAINTQSPANDLPIELKSIEIGDNQLKLRAVTKPAD